jgi:hypothetical protein
VPGVQGSGAAAHGVPALGGLLRAGRLAEGLAVELQERVAADDESVLEAAGDGLRLADGEVDDDLRRGAGVPVLRHAAHHDLG